jgi:hypothetical protein
MSTQVAPPYNRQDSDPEKQGSFTDDEKKQLDDGAVVNVLAASDAFDQLAAEEENHDIKLRTMTWQRCALLLFGEQVCLAIMAQAWSLKVLGWVPGLLTSFLSGVFFWITSYTMWKFIMKNPQVRDICDIGYLLFGKSNAAYVGTAIMLLLNNVMLCGFHVLTGTKILNTMSDHSRCSVVFAVIVTIISIVLSLPRTLNHVSLMSIVSAACMGISILLFMIFAGTEDHPATGYGGDFPTVGLVKTYAFPQAGTTWVDCMNAVLNITFLWVPQILFPTFISEMKRPQDFPKALGALAIASFVLFTVPAIVGFRYLGQYAEAPAFGSLEEKVKKISFVWVIVPTVVIGVIYANVSGKFIYRSIMRGSRHEHSNTVIGWGVWGGVMTIFWVIAFIFGEVIPSMGDFLSLLGSAFDSFYGFIYWAVAFWHLYRGKFFATRFNSMLTVIHILVMVIGLFLLGPGLYAAVEAIIADYSGSTRPAFSCKNLAL